MTPTTNALATAPQRPERTPQAEADYAAIQEMFLLLDILRGKAATMRGRNTSMRKISKRLDSTWVDLVAAVMGVESPHSEKRNNQ